MAFSWNRDAVLSTASTGATGGAVGAAEAPEQGTVGDLLTQLLEYFTANLPLFPALVPAAQAMSPAIKAYGTGSSQDPYGPVRRVVALVTAAQQTDPAIPSP